MDKHGPIDAKKESPFKLAPYPLYSLLYPQTERPESHIASQKIQERVVGIPDETPLTLPIITFCEGTPRLNRWWLLFCRIILYNSKPSPGTGLSDRHSSDPLCSLKMWLLWNSVTSDFGCWSSYWILFPGKEKFIILEMIMTKRFPLPPLVQGLQLHIFISAYPGDQLFEDWKAAAIHAIKESWTRVCVANSWHLRKEWKKALTHSSSMNFPKMKTGNSMPQTVLQILA